MPNEAQRETKLGQARWAAYLNLALYQLLDPRFRSVLLAVALVEALTAPFLGQKLAFAAIATGVVSIGMTAAVVGFRIDAILQLYTGELQKTQDVTSQPATEWPQPKFFKN
jgi:hypothetical protein